VNWLARLSLLLGLNAVPVVGVAGAGWTNATALVLYWYETVILVVLVALRIHLHRRWTNKRGHYCEVLVKTTRGSSSKTQTTIGYFGTSFIIVAVMFAIIQAIFLSFILHKAQLLDKVSFAQLSKGLAATTVFLCLGFFIDLRGLRERPFAWIRDMSNAVLWRVFLVQIVIICGVIGSSWYTTGSSNTADGSSALMSNTTGTANTAVGSVALQVSNANDDTACGFGALEGNTSGSQNSGFGRGALGQTTTGSQNTAAGYQALVGNSTGINNVALGFDAGFNLTTGSNNIDIGANVLGNAGEANTIRIGTVGTQTKTFIAGIHGATASGGAAVFVSSTGELGTLTSSARFKEAIKPMDKVSEAILALKPVTFRYKKEIDADRIPQFGLVAEEVEKVNPDLVARDADGKVYTVRYEAVNAMLLNEFLKEHKTVQEQEATITALRANDVKQEAAIAQQQKQIAALTAGLQKVSAQLQMSKPAPRTVLNNR
jgi:hypothetical protein